MLEGFWGCLAGVQGEVLGQFPACRPIYGA